MGEGYPFSPNQAREHCGGSKIAVIANVRFGSKADIRACPFNVRFTPKSGH
jgi:hypothetical protein